MMDAATQLAANANRYQPLPVSQSRDPNRERVKKERAVVHGFKIEVDICPLFRKSANL